MDKKIILDSLENIQASLNPSVIDKLEADLKGEVEAINLYDKHIKEINNKEIKDKLIEIRNEEKTHYKELMELLRKYSK